MRHKWASLIHEWVENMNIQFEVKYTGDREWTEFDPLTQKWMPHHEYRIKPEKKADVVKHYQMSSGFILNTVPCNGCGEDDLTLTFDGETGKLIKAEVLNENS